MKIGRMLLAGIVTLGFGVATISAPAYADDEEPTTTTGGVTCPKGSVREGEVVPKIAQCNVKEDDDLIKTINAILNVVIGVLGLATVAVIILGGVQYVTSTGDAGKVKKAKDTIMYGIIGLIIAILAFAIVNFVLSTAFAQSTPAPAAPTE